MLYGQNFIPIVALTVYKRYAMIPSDFTKPRVPLIFASGTMLPKRFVMNKKLLRFLYYWRMPVFLFILFFVLIIVGTYTEGSICTACGIIWLCIDIPFLIYFTIRSIYRRIRDAIACHRNKTLEIEYHFPELNVLQAISEEIDSVRGLSSDMKLRYFVLRFLSIVLIIGGSIGVLCFMPSIFLAVIFTLVIIAGATIWLIANPNKYNERVEGARMISCPEEMTNEQLCDLLRRNPTSLGIPRLAIAQGFKKPIIVYGSEADAFIYVIYRARFSDVYYVTSICSSYVKEYLTAPDELIDEQSTHTEDHDSTFYLNELTSAVEQAVALFEAK